MDSSAVCDTAGRRSGQINSSTLCLHPLNRFDAEEVEAAFDRAGREVAKLQPARAEFRRFCLENWAVLEERAVVRSELVEIGCEVVGPIVGGDAVERFGELEKNESQCPLLRSGKQHDGIGCRVSGVGCQ